MFVQAYLIAEFFLFLFKIVLVMGLNCFLHCNGEMPVCFLNSIQKYLGEDTPIFLEIVSILRLLESNSFFAALICNIVLYSKIVILVALKKHLHSQVLDS